MFFHEPVKSGASGRVVSAELKSSGSKQNKKTKEFETRNYKMVFSSTHCPRRQRTFLLPVTRVLLTLRIRICILTRLSNCFLALKIFLRNKMTNKKVALMSQPY